jgi:hypothetical protein
VFTLQAPYPALQTSTVLPNPAFSDGESLTGAVVAKRAIDGTLRTYIKRKGGRRKLTWTFLLRRNKGLELREFIKSYYRSVIKITDHNNRMWVGNFMNDPFEFASSDDEARTITLEFEGTEI